MSDLHGRFADGVEAEGEFREQDGGEQPRYPGLDKRHGFFQVITKNQVSRNEYHWTREEWQQRRRETVEAEVGFFRRDPAGFLAG